MPGAIGRTPLTERFAALVPGWSTIVNTPEVQLFLGKMPFRQPPHLAAAELAPDVKLPDTPSYLRWVMMIPPDHPAPPGGLGANLAFIDGELLCRKLLKVRSGTVGLIPALADYERQMCDYAAEALAGATELFKSFDKMRATA